MLQRTVLAIALPLLSAAAPLHAQSTQTASDSTFGRIRFSLGEHVVDSTKASLFSVSYQTERKFNCLLPLDATMTRNGSTAILSDWRIVPVEICPSAVGPASGGRTLPLSLGANQVVIRQGDIEDRYMVTVDQELIHVRPMTPARVSATADTLIRRIIPGSFAVRCGDAEWSCARTYRELALVPGLSAFALSSTGRNPFGLWYDAQNPADENPVHYFMLSSRTPMQSVLDAVQRVCDEMKGPGGNCFIAIDRWTGQRWWPSASKPEAQQ
jgi:hypothetical protein